MLRASGGPGGILGELSNQRIAVSMEDAARINACAVAVQVFIGGEFETQSVHNMTRLVDQGQRYGIPVLAVNEVGKELTLDARRYLRAGHPDLRRAWRALRQDLLLRRPRTSTRSLLPARCRR